MQQANNQNSVSKEESFSIAEESHEFVNSDGASFKNVPAASARLVETPSQETPLHLPRSMGEVRRLRMRRRVMVGSGFACLYLCALLVFSLVGAVDRATLLMVFIAVLVASQVFYFLHARSEDKKKSEKALTAPIAVFYLAVMLTVTYAAPESRPIFTSFVFVGVAYGMYYLSRRAMLLLSAGTLAGYVVIIGLHHLQRHDPELLKAELLSLLVLSLTLPAFVLLTGRVRQLHSALYKAGIKIRNIEEKARRDPLLGCYNRRFMVAALEEQKRLTDANGAPLCLAVIDLDHFKRINDEVGHLAGDEVLRSFARIAQQNTRQFDIFGRYGGEEFLLVLPQTSLLAALNTAERIREKVEQHNWSASLHAPVTVSIGLTQYNAGESVLDLFSRSDTAMYLAKRGGRNQVVVEEPHVELWQNVDMG